MSAASIGVGSRWLVNPAVDLLLGCGGGYLLFIALIAFPAVQGAMAPALALVLPVLALLINTPHYGATLLRVYESRQERIHYALFSVWITAAIGAFAILGLYVYWVGSVLITLYLSWSTWHFAAQNYGLSIMFLRRRGVPVSPAFVRLLRASFVLSFVLTILGMHGPTGAYGLAPVPRFEREVYEFLSLGIPAAITSVAIPVVAGACVIVIVMLAMNRPKGVTLRDVAPTALLILVQASWFTIPAYLIASGARSGESLERYGIWIPFFHSLQYLWICAYYARRAERPVALDRYLGKTVLAGAAVITLPMLVFAPSSLGNLTFDAGLFILVFSAVNVHHFMLDGAIWKLRDRRVARVLVRGNDVDDEALQAGRSHARRWLRGGLWSLAWLSLAISVYSIVELEFGVRRPLTSGQLERVIAASERLRWAGLESHAIHQNIALQIAHQIGAGGADDPRWAQVRHHFERSLTLHPSAQAWGGLATLEYNAGNREAARRDFDEALTLDPESVDDRTRRAQVLLDLGREREALADLRRAAELARGDPGLLQLIRELEARAGGG